MIKQPAAKQYKRILGIDSSTTGVAWTLFYNKKPQKWGKIGLTKIKSMEDKLAHIAQEYPKLLQELKPDYVFIEKTIFLRSAQTARVLSYVVGALMALTSLNGTGVNDIEPMVAKGFFSYTPMNRKFSAATRRKLGKTEGNKFLDKLRKSQVQRLNEYNWPSFDASDHDISDSCSIAAYGYDKMVERLQIKTDKHVALDLDELKRLGLDGLL